MIAPRRLQRSRAKGWRMPPGAAYIGRPTRHGNPFSTVGILSALEQSANFDKIAANEPLYLACVNWAGPVIERCAAITVELYDELLGKLDPAELEALLAPLRGRDVACWCGLCVVHREGLPLGIRCPDCPPCHGDVLLRRANA